MDEQRSSEEHQLSTGKTVSNPMGFLHFAALFPQLLPWLVPFQGSQVDRRWALNKCSRSRRLWRRRRHVEDGCSIHYLKFMWKCGWGGGCLWNICGLSVVYLWNIYRYGISMEYLLSIWVNFITTSSTESHRW